MQVKAKITKRFVERLEYTAQGQSLYFDTELKGFGVRVTRNAKTFIAQGRVNGAVCRVSIGKCEVFTADVARHHAKKILANMAQGADPNKAKAALRKTAITLGEVFEDYVATRHLKPATALGYRKVFARCLSDWLSVPITKITKDMIERRHQQLSDHKAQANLTMRILRAVMTFAANKYEDSRGNALLAENPVKRLSQNRAWHRIPRRQTTIPLYDLEKWYGAVMQLDNPIMRDYLQLMLFTGLRKSEAAQLRWENVDLKAKTLLIPGEVTKNHKPHLLPLTDFLVDLLEARQRTSEYVFPSTGKRGYLVEVRKAMRKVTKESGVPFMLHDLRRRFLTIAESQDIPYYALKRLANHRDTSDVTAGYIVADVERLREPMAKITAELMFYAGMNPEKSEQRLAVGI